MRMKLGSSRTDVDQLHKRPTTFGGRPGQNQQVGRLNRTMRKPVKTGGRQRAGYLRCHTQDGFGRHRSMLLNPRLDCLTLQILRDIHELPGFFSEIKNLGDVDMMKLLGGACLFLELLLYLLVDVCDRDELQRNWFTGPIVYGLVSNRCAGSSEFIGRPVGADRDSVVFKESCVFHIVSWSAARAKTIRALLYHLT